MRRALHLTNCSPSHDNVRGHAQWTYLRYRSCNVQKTALSHLEMPAVKYLSKKPFSSSTLKPSMFLISFPS